MSGPILEFPYRPRRRLTLAAAAGFTGCTGWAAMMAVGNDRGLVINRIIRLDPGAATGFWWLLAAVAAALAAGGVWALRLSYTSSMAVRLTDTELSAPRYGFSRAATVIALRDIEGAGIMEVTGQRLLTVRSPAATLSIPESMLPDRAAFGALHDSLMARLSRRPATG